MHQDYDVQEFTYWFSIQQLWKAKGWKGKFIPHTTAVLLIFCSGIWPHLKLFLLHLTWLFPMRSAVRRQRFLHWLSTLGKWSLADVLSICVMIGVLHLEWQVDPAEIKEGILRETHLVIQLVHGMYSATELCTELLQYDCTSPKKFSHITKCKGCRSLVNEAFNHPSWAKDTGKRILNGVETSGGGFAELSVIGMRGIYAFCLAVIMSILLSLIVDVFDMRARRAQKEAARLEAELAAEASADNNSMTRRLLTDSGNEDQAAVVVSRRRPPVDFIYPPPVEESVFVLLMRNVIPVVTTVVVLLAIFLPTMVRKTDGAFPDVLRRILGINWTKQYSLQTLVTTTGLAGGWDILLMATFSLFIVVGPALRSGLCVLDCTQWTPERFRRPLAIAIDFIGAFCAWEVIFVAIIMVGLLMPGVTDTIINYPQCAIVKPDGTCLQVEFNALPAFALVAVGGFLLLIVALVAVRSFKKEEAESDRTPTMTREVALVDGNVVVRYHQLGENNLRNEAYV